MEASTTVNKMLLGNSISVPNYQRAYSWDTEFDKSKKPLQVNVFLNDLEEYIKSSVTSPYYFGHFLFEEKSENEFGVIDGQQRLTTIIIFLSALYTKLKSLRILTEEEEVLYENMIRRRLRYVFSTVYYDDQFFKDYVVDQVRVNRGDLDTISKIRIANAFDYFKEAFSNKNEEDLTEMLNAVEKAFCSTYPVKDESEAIQMFIFQNARGKSPSKLEIIKAQFMYNVHLYANDDRDELISEIKNRFEEIYRSISSIEYNIDEDSVLLYTSRVHFNSLWESNPEEKINKILAGKDPIPFIKSFTLSLATSFQHLKTFFGKDERENIEIHSLITLGGLAIALPFIIKAYSFNLPTHDISRLSSTFEKLVLRHRLIGTRADMTSRLNDVFEQFNRENPSIDPIIGRIEWMKEEKHNWWAYWSNDALYNNIQGWINPATAKFIFWKYENHLIKQGKSGYSVIRYDNIESPELEHIAPQTPTEGESVAAGYCVYDEEFSNEYLECLGNYLLLSKSHNCSVGNRPFSEKSNSYIHLAQQREVQDMTKVNIFWGKEEIKLRKDKLINFILENF